MSNMSNNLVYSIAPPSACLPQDVHPVHTYPVPLSSMTTTAHIHSTLPQTEAMSPLSRPFQNVSQVIPRLSLPNLVSHSQSVHHRPYQHPRPHPHQTREIPQHHHQQQQQPPVNFQLPRSEQQPFHSPSSSFADSETTPLSDTHEDPNNPEPFYADPHDDPRNNPTLAILGSYIFATSPVSTQRHPQSTHFQSSSSSNPTIKRQSTTGEEPACAVLEWARKRKEGARQEYKVRTRAMSGQIIKRRKKGDAPISSREQHRRRLAMNQESAAAARHAQEVYTAVLENTVKSQDNEIKRLTAMLHRYEQRN